MDKLCRIRWVSACALIIGFAVAFSCWLYVYGGQGIFFDAQGYYDLGVGIATGGLASFSSNFRTYGYPLFVSLGWLLSDRDPSSARFAVFILQLVIFLAACLYGAYSIHSLFRDYDLTLAFLALTALNPLLLIYTTEVLSDLLSSVLIFVAVLVATHPPSTGPAAAGTSKIHAITWGFASGAIAGIASIVRPANTPIAGAVALIWILRHVVCRDISFRAVLAGAAGLVIPFLPQMYANAAAFGTVHPLVVSNLYSYQTEVGIRLLKYGTLLLPGKAGGLLYVNPFLPQDVSTLSDFALRAPLGFLLTLGLHTFSMFDQALPFAYIVDPHPVYRWPLTVANFAFLFMSLLGVWLWGRSVARRRTLDRSDIVFAGLLIAGVAYVPLYLPSAVENRFGLPEYLLASPFCVLGLSRLREWVAARERKRLLAFAIALCVFVLGTGFVSAWLEHQAPGLDPSAQPDSGYLATPRQIDARFGTRLELRASVLKSPPAVKGGDSLFLTLSWRCNGASTDAYDIQVDLIDSEGHAFGHGRGRMGGIVSPCPSRWWEPHAEEGQVLSFDLSPALPPGQYRIAVSVYDKNADQYISAAGNVEDLREANVVVADVDIAKNKSSIAASELAIEQPFFVDMREIRLLGFVPPPATIKPGETLPVVLYWRARGQPQGDYIVLVQLRDANGALVSEQLSQPAGGQYPTTLWSVGEVLMDWHDLPVPVDLAAGDYQVGVLLRDRDKGDVLGQAPVSVVLVIN